MFGIVNWLLTRKCNLKCEYCGLVHEAKVKEYPRLCDLYKNEKDCDYIIKCLEKIESDYSYDILADEAIFKLGEIFENIKKNNKKAAEYYKKILLSHPNSIYVSQARKRFRNIKNDLLPEEKNIPKEN